MVVGCWGPRQQGRTSSSDYVTPVTAAPVRGCTPDCLRKPAAGSHPSSDRGIPVSLPLPQARAYARGLQGYRRTLPSPPHLPTSTLARAFAIVSPFLPFLPSSEADLPRGRPTPPSTTTPPTPPSRGRAENTEHHPAATTPASFSRRPSYAATAITFAGKSSEAVREPGLTLQGVVSDHSEPFFLVLYFFSLFLLSLSFSRERRYSFAQSIK